MTTKYDITLRECANLLGLSFDTNLRNSHAVTLAKRKIRSKKFGQQWMVCGKDITKHIHTVISETKKDLKRMGVKA
jgi:hypothetical protein